MCLPALRNRAEGGERLCGHPFVGVGGAVVQAWGRLEPGVGTSVHMGHRGRAGRMRAFNALSDVLPDASRRPATADAKVTPGTYNPDGGERVQLAWQRFWTSPPLSTSLERGDPHQRAARPYGRPARRLFDPACPVRPAACR
ncbi:hypothetical protein GCM10027072_34060 [Streptomyces bullii]